MALDQKICVCIRGMSGLLGNRLALAIQKQSDMEITTGIFKADRSLERITKGRWTRELLPKHLYLDDTHKTVKRVNDQNPNLNFQPVDQLTLAKLCDVVIDATAPGNRSEHWDERYRQFRKPVILQSGEFPVGRLIAPPLIVPGDETNIYRQGDCIMSGLSPVLAPLRDVIDGIRIMIITQYGFRLNDFPINQRIMATYLGDSFGENQDNLEKQLESELKDLFPSKKVIMEGILHVPAQDYYNVFLHLDTKYPLSTHELGEMLEGQPRVLVLPPEIGSTYEIDHIIKEEAAAWGEDIPPVAIYGRDFMDKTSKTTDHRVRFTIFSKLVTILPNIDSIRILVKGMDPIEAMRLTDRYAGFNHNRGL